MNTSTSRPVERKPLQLLLQKLGRLTCRHAYGLVLHRGRMFLHCDLCGAETVGFEIGSKLALHVGTRRPRRSL